MKIFVSKVLASSAAITTPIVIRMMTGSVKKNSRVFMLDPLCFDYLESFCYFEKERRPQEVFSC